VAVGTNVFSFYRPSLGDTSTILTLFGYARLALYANLGYFYMLKEYYLYRK